MAVLEGFLGWLREIDGHTSFFVVGVEKNRELIDYSALIQTLVGGGLTIIAAFLTFWWTARHENSRARTAERQAKAADALSGYHKLAQWTDVIGNISNHIDKCFADAHASGLEPTELFQSVPPFAGRFFQPNALESKEFSFLLTTEYFSLLNDVTDVERHGVNISKLFDEYSRLRVEFEDWIDSLPDLEREFDGPFSEARIPKKYQEKFHLRASQLNLVLGGIIELLAVDVKKSQGTLTAFASAAHNSYKPHFPKLEIEFQQPKPI